MKKILTIISAFIIVISVCAQDTNYVDPNYQAEKAKKPKSETSIKDKMYFGGTLGFSFGTYTSILIEPMVGFKMTEKLSTGIGIGYRYTSTEYSTGEPLTYSSYLGRIFSRYIIIPKLYAHVEFMAESYENKAIGPCYRDPLTGAINCPSGRTTVPYVFLGGGYRSPGPRGSFIIQVLFNVLQSNENGAEFYPAGYPYITLGYIGGF